MELYIAEKPSVGKAIAENLGGPLRSVRGSRGPTHIEVGNDKIVTWCFGHILEMCPPEAYDPVFENWRSSASKLPIIPEQWKLAPVSSAEKQIGVIRDLLKRATVVIHAGDPDREGQLLVDEVLEFLGNRAPVRRILPNAMDAASMAKILADQRDNKQFRGLYESALGRQRADFLVGINFTRAATYANEQSGMRGVLSIGRVQTPTLAMIVRRDLEIENFVPQTYFDVAAMFRHGNGVYVTRWKPSKSQKGLDSEGRVIDESVASALVQAVQGKPGQITEYKVEDGSQRAPLPFSLSALQSKASTLYGMSAQKVLDIAQSLYEVHKVATYPRTDCQYLPETQFVGAPAVLAAVSKLGGEFSGLAAGANPKIRSQVWNDSKVTAHHAIVPTSNASYAQLSADERKIFTLICKFYLAQFYPEFTFKKTTVLTECGGQQFVATGRTPVDLGWRRVFGASADEAKSEDAKGRVEEDDTQTLPVMATGDKVLCEKLSKDRKQTKPPAPYSEGTLIRAMTNVHEIVDDPETKRKLKEVKGIGTEATRASVIEILKKRLFIDVRAGKIRSTPAGRQFIEALPKQLTDVTMTAMWESLLDKVEEAALPLQKFMEGQSEFVLKMTKRLLDSSISVAVGFKNAGASDMARQGAGGACPKCNKGIMRLFQAKKGANAGKYFLGCSDFENCKHTVDIEGQEEPRKASRSGGKSGGKSSGKSGSGKSAGGAKLPRGAVTPAPRTPSPYPRNVKDRGRDFPGDSQDDAEDDRGEDRGGRGRS